jgi:hypothetical protein
MSVVTQLHFQILEEINYMFRLFSQPDDGPTRKGPKHVADFSIFENTVVLRPTFIHLISTRQSVSQEEYFKELV